MWKASVRPSQTLSGTGVCHKKHRVKAPVVPVLLTSPGVAFCTTVIFVCSCSPDLTCFCHLLLSLCIVLLINVLDTHVELPFFDRMSECDILYILKYLPYLYTICYC